MDVSDTCWSLKTEAMSDAQRAILESVLLVPLFPNCTADGYTYEELTVISSDGTRTLYRDTGCSYFGTARREGHAPEQLGRWARQRRKHRLHSVALPFAPPPRARE
jgi:hypothetical protein